jgi:hypothetical protein
MAVPLLTAVLMVTAWGRVDWTELDWTGLDWTGSTPGCRSVGPASPSSMAIGAAFGDVLPGT